MSTAVFYCEVSLYFVINKASTINIDIWGVREKCHGKDGLKVSLVDCGSRTKDFVARFIMIRRRYSLWFWHWQAAGSCVAAALAVDLFPTVIDMSTPQYDKQLAKKQSWFKRICSWLLPCKHRASSTSQHPDARPTTATTTATDVPFNNVSPLPVSPAQPSTVSRPMGIGEHISHASCTLLTRFTDHNPKRAQGNPISNTVRGMYWVLGVAFNN